MNEADVRLLREVNDKVFYKKSIGPASAKRLVEIIAALELEREMWAANADEAALLAARQAARIAELERNFNGLVQGHNGMLIEAERVGHEFICKIILDDLLVGEAGGNYPSRMQIELRNLRAQVAEAHSMGYPVNLFEKFADENKHGQAG